MNLKLWDILLKPSYQGIFDIYNLQTWITLSSIWLSRAVESQHGPRTKWPVWFCAIGPSWAAGHLTHLTLSSQHPWAYPGESGGAHMHFLHVVSTVTTAKIATFNKCPSKKASPNTVMELQTSQTLDLYSSALITQPLCLLYLIANNFFFSFFSK